MAHNIMEENVFTGRGIKPWHHLGITVDGTLTWREAIKVSGLDWKVKKESLFDSKGNELDAWGVFREDKSGKDVFLGTVGNGYTVIQNEQAFEFIDALIGNEGAHYDTAGALGNGERIFCSAYLPAAGFDVVDGDTHEVYLLFQTSHDGTLSALCKLTDIRVVCQNTLNRALASGGQQMIIKHTRNADMRIAQAKALLISGKKTAQVLKERMIYLSNHPFTTKKVDKVLKHMFQKFADKEGKVSTRTTHTIEKILELFESNDKNAFPKIKGTGYNLLNAFTEYADHFRSVKVNGGNEKVIRVESAVFGSAEKFKEKAFEYIYSIAA